MKTCLVSLLFVSFLFTNSQPANSMCVYNNTSFAVNVVFNCNHGLILCGWFALQPQFITNVTFSCDPPSPHAEPPDCEGSFRNSQNLLQFGTIIPKTIRTVHRACYPNKGGTIKIGLVPRLAKVCMQTPGPDLDALAFGQPMQCLGASAIELLSSLGSICTTSVEPHGVVVINETNCVPLGFNLQTQQNEFQCDLSC